MWTFIFLKPYKEEEMKPVEIQKPFLLGLSHNGASWKHSAEIKKENHERE